MHRLTPQLPGATDRQGARPLELQACQRPRLRSALSFRSFNWSLLERDLAGFGDHAFSISDGDGVGSRGRSEKPPEGTRRLLGYPVGGDTG